MRKLFDQFEQLSTEAQALLERGISQMRDGIAPAPSLCQEITSALSSLRTAYDDIRRTLPDHVLAEELPEGELRCVNMRKPGRIALSAGKRQCVMCSMNSSVCIQMRKSTWMPLKCTFGTPRKFWPAWIQRKRRLRLRMFRHSSCSWLA